MNKTIALNLIKLQTELNVPKGNFNNFGKYKYRSAEDILLAVKPLLIKYECLLTLTDEIVQVGASLFIKATATIECGDFTKSVSAFSEITEHKGMSKEQSCGASSSYSRKYALNGIFLLSEKEDDVDSFKQDSPKEKEDDKFNEGSYLWLCDFLGSVTCENELQEKWDYAQRFIRELNSKDKADIVKFKNELRKKLQTL